MLFMLGGVRVTHSGFNVEKMGRENNSEYAEYKVVGAEPKYEFMGDAGRKITLSGKIFPFALGGYSALSILEGMRQSGVPTMLVRGDGGFFAWVIIESVKEEHKSLNYLGVGQEVEHEITLLRADPPIAAGLGSFLSIF
ncbi:MAG: phage tail protein [Beijerinckiaceae bacterium]